jgi:SpoVK/Ycf46/Vps4 family AAA+-type ATPase
MGRIREDLMRQQFQTEIDAARRMESSGQAAAAGIHYVRAASIYRKLASGSPKGSVSGIMESAAQYENLGEKLKSAGKDENEDFSGIIDSMIIFQKPDTKWEDIGGLDDVKADIREAIIIPFIEKKPAFVKAPRSILLYGPPGTGKTMLAKASSNTLNAIFFEARASSLLSKYFGESGKLINALFRKAREKQPSLIFMDEIDSVAASRTKDMGEAGRRVLGQFLSEIDGFGTKKDENVLVIAATNKPWDIDDALLSRFQKKIYIPLPDMAARESIFRIHLKSAELSGASASELAFLAEGYSGREISNVCMEAISKMVKEMNPELQSLDAQTLQTYSLKTRPLTKADFEKVFQKIRPASGQAALRKYEEWGREFGE